eukprot:234937_1
MDSLDHCDKCSILVNLQNGIIVGSGLYSGNIKDHNICPNSVTGEHHFLKMFKRIDESPKELSVIVTCKSVTFKPQYIVIKPTKGARISIAPFLDFIGNYVLFNRYHYGNIITASGYHMAIQNWMCCTAYIKNSIISL